MDHHQFLAERFEADRAHLRSVAYRLLGSMSDAEDAVQETWLRLSRADTRGVENLTGWLTTVVARVSLDMLRARTSRREDHFGDSVPEPPRTQTLPCSSGIRPQVSPSQSDTCGLPPVDLVLWKQCQATPSPRNHLWSISPPQVGNACRRS